MYTNRLNTLKTVKIVKKDKDWMGRPTMVNTPEMVDSVNALILADRRVTVEDITEQMGFKLDKNN